MENIIEINRRRLFSLNDAQDLLPLIYRMTEDASREVRKLMQCLEALPQRKGERGLEVEAAIETAIDRWQKKIERLGGLPKGLWLADFDNGDGYWCWKFPETSIDHCHGYQDGFSGRRLISVTLGERQ